MQFLLRPHVLFEPSRLDKVLPLLTTLSRHESRKLIDEGKVALNGTVRKKQSARVFNNDVVTLPASIAENPQVQLLQQPFTLPNLEFLYQSDRFAVVNKPAGLLSQPSEDGLEPSLKDAYHWHRACQGLKNPFFHLQHRLDRFTSGACLFVNAKSLMPAVTRAWDLDKVQRTYLAVVEGSPAFEEEIVSAPIARVPNHWRFRVDMAGKTAKSRIKVVARHEVASVVEVQLLSGRTHQARVHLSFVGHPVVNDTAYGASSPLEAQFANPAIDKSWKTLQTIYEAAGVMPETHVMRQLLARPLLHSHKLQFLEPIKGERINVTAPVPADMRRFMQGIMQE